MNQSKRLITAYLIDPGYVRKSMETKTKQGKIKRKKIPPKTPKGKTTKTQNVMGTEMQNTACLARKFAAKTAVSFFQ